MPRGRGTKRLPAPARCLVKASATVKELEAETHHKSHAGVAGTHKSSRRVSPCTGALPRHHPGHAGGGRCCCVSAAAPRQPMHPSRSASAATYLTLTLLHQGLPARQGARGTLMTACRYASAARSAKRSGRGRGRAGVTSRPAASSSAASRAATAGCCEIMYLPRRGAARRALGRRAARAGLAGHARARRRMLGVCTTALCAVVCLLCKSAEEANNLRDRAAANSGRLA